MDGGPVALIYGSRPVWREFALGMARGEDVRQLTENLTALGFRGHPGNDRYTAATAASVRAWQRRLGVAATGRLPPGTVVFAPAEIRIARAVAPLGGRVCGGPVLGIANVMVIAVLERRNEIGLRRALGARRAHVGAQFLAESVLLAALGGLSGCAIGTAITAAAAQHQGWSISVPALAVWGGMAAAIAIGAVPACTRRCAPRASPRRRRCARPDHRPIATM